MFRTCTVWLAIALLLAACSDSGGGKDDAGVDATDDSGVGHSGGASGSDSGAAGSGGSDTSPVIKGPAIDSAPSAWMAPTDCGGVGELCEVLSCGGEAICQSIGNVCVPGLVDGALPSKSAERPYCAAYTCMTFEEASCFCLGPAGETVSECSSPSALAGLCEGQGASCADATCCDGLTCVEGSRAGSMVCEQVCTGNDECESGCCTDLRDTGDMVCAPLSACEDPCTKTGEACTPGTTGECCRGTCIDSQVEGYGGCRPYCTVNSDCDTGCCQPFSNTSGGFCVDGLFCDCGGPVDGCTATIGPCCEGYECTGTSSAGLSCSKLCTDNADCTTGCCGTVNGADWRTCQDATRCD